MWILFLFLKTDFFKKKEDGTIGKEPGRVIFAAAEQGTIATVLAV